VLPLFRPHPNLTPALQARPCYSWHVLQDAKPNGSRSPSRSTTKSPSSLISIIHFISHARSILILPLPSLTQSLSPSSSFPSFVSFLIGILTPCFANALLKSVLSITPGNFFAE